MAKELSAPSAHECLFVEFLSKKPKKVSEVLQHPGWVDVMQDELNQFSRNKVWTLVPAPYVKTPMVPPNKLGRDLNGKIVNETQFRGMIGSLMYLTTSRPDIQFLTCLCARYQENPKESHLIDVKRIFRYLKGAIRGDIGINTFRNALRAHYLPHSSMYVSPPSITIVRPWFATIGYSGEIRAKGTLKKNCFPPRENVVPYPMFISLLLEYMMSGYDNRELTINPTQAIYNLDVLVDLKAPNPSSQTEEVPQGKKPGSKSGLRRKQSSKHASKSKTEASKSKTGESKKETQSSLAKDKSPSHALSPTPVVGEMHKEAQQAAGGPTSLGATRHDASTDSTAKADLGLSALNDSIPAQQDQTKFAGDRLKTAHTDSGTNEESRAVDISKKIKLEDLFDLLKDTRSAFFTLDSPQDEPIIILDESQEEQEVIKDKDTRASSHDL
uniref:Uncharacterized mitochondrial protein AtMg00810-like n=1 Tax=Tanacetum cinerariifolium TaxID=118510 RepID=A0A6L2J4V5_TANCI|nr:uncharacterized mitochondrial protein AtMg00810-like [Tanacetum cinerariifolium]